MKNPKLGKLIEGAAERDAVHIAIAPVVAGEALDPGDPVGLEEGKAVKVSPSYEVGVVDPFLDCKILLGQRFWLLLKPDTITNLRHEWDHPAFSRTEPEPAEDDYYGCSGCYTGE